MFNPILPIALALLAISLFGYRHFCSRRLVTETGTPGSLEVGPPGELAARNYPVVESGPHADTILRPAELAYLVREGDRSHATIVLAFDLLHRAVKSLQTESTGVTLAPYEQRMFTKVKEYAKRWLEEKTVQLPDPRSRDVRQLARQVSGLYWFLMKSVRPFVSEIMEDPRRIRRYFTFAGLMRLLADVGSAGYREALETEMVSDMRARGLLMSDSNRKRSVAFLTAGLAGGLVIASAVVLLLVPNANLAVVAFLTSGFVALGLRLIWGVREFIPLYSELTDVANHIRRSGWRLILVRFVLRLVGGVLYSAVAVAALALLAVQVLCLHTFFPGALVDTIALCLMLCGIWLFLLELAFDGYKMKLRSQPSARARKLMAEKRHKLAAASPVETFRQMLASRDYSPECSELLAIYGIETLFLLA